MHLMALGWHFHAFPLITSLQCILGLVGFCERQVMNDHACFSLQSFPRWAFSGSEHYVQGELGDIAPLCTELLLQV